MRCSAASRAPIHSQALTGLGIDPRRVAVEHNQIVVKRGAYESTRVEDRDEVEIVNFVGGGSGSGGQENSRD